MDSVTQFVLGAAVGEAVLKGAPQGGVLSNKSLRWAPFWLGGLIGTLPDLDVIFRPFLNGPEALGFHRGLTHSIFFCTAVTPVLAWILARRFRQSQVTWRQWNLFVWLGLNTHWMIDSLTTYGTQVFLPFTNYPVNVGSVFIIDPIYTISLLVGLLWTLWVSRGGRVYRPNGVRAGLIFSTLYLVLTLGSKYTVLAKFERSLQAQGIAYQQLISVPTPFNSILWYGYADTGDDVWVGDSSLLDPAERPVFWQKISKNKTLLPGFGEGVADRRLLWFSRGFYRLDLVDGKPLLIDLRFSRLQSWLLPISPEGDDYIFRFALKPESAKGPYNDFDQLRPVGRLSDFPWASFLRRLLGGNAHEAGLAFPQN